MSGRISKMFLMVALGVGQMFIGCGSPTEETLDDGRLFVINNCRPEPPGHIPSKIFVIFDEKRWEIPFNMDYNGNPTGVGPVELTQKTGPLTGGTRLNLKYGSRIGQGGYREYELPVTIDGNITVEIYSLDWWDWRSRIGARVHKGYWNNRAQIPPEHKPY